MKIYLLDSNEWQKLDSKSISKDEIESIVTVAACEAAKILANVSDKLSIIVKPGLPHVRKDIGVGGSTYDAELIDLTFDASLPYSAEKLKDHLRQTVFHEMNHALRYRLVKRQSALAYDAINEGLASVFERDYANASRRPKTYDEPAMKRAAKEIFDESNNNPDWFFKNAYVAGAWIVDRAIKNSGLSVAQLTSKTTDEIIKLADLQL